MPSYRWLVLSRIFFSFRSVQFRLWVTFPFLFSFVLLRSFGPFQVQVHFPYFRNEFLEFFVVVIVLFLLFRHRVCSLQSWLPSNWFVRLGSSGASCTRPGLLLGGQRL